MYTGGTMQSRPRHTHATAARKSPAAKSAVRRHSKQSAHAPQSVLTPTFPMRINKYLALHKHGTRRGADELIEKGQVFINRRPAKLGDIVQKPDAVEVRRTGKTPTYTYIAFNKPSGVNTHQETTGEKDVVSMLPKDLRQLRLFPLGRLDKDSEGLIILTNDGRVTDRLLNPIYNHEKMYEVKVKIPLRNNFKEKMGAGVNIEGYTTKPCKIEILNEKKFRVTLTEGKMHQIRRMCAALFNEVASLRRISIMNIRINNLPSGGYRIIQNEELAEFLRSLSL